MRSVPARGIGGMSPPTLEKSFDFRPSEIVSGAVLGWNSGQSTAKSSHCVCVIATVKLQCGFCVSVWAVVYVVMFRQTY